MPRPIHEDATIAVARNARFAIAIGVLAFALSAIVGALALTRSEAKHMAYCQDRAVQGATAGVIAIESMYPFTG